MRIILFAFLIAVSLSSCYELELITEPTVSFTAEPNGEGIVVFSASTTNEETYLWDFGDGSFSEGKSPTHTYENNGIYNVTLSTKGLEGESIITGQVTVNDITGSLIFWLSALKTMEIEISVDGQYCGKITGVSLIGVPPCGDKYSVTVNNLSEGSHTFEGKESNSISPKRWMGVVLISGRKCNAMGLTF